MRKLTLLLLLCVSVTACTTEDPTVTCKPNVPATVEEQHTTLPNGDHRDVVKETRLCMQYGFRDTPVITVVKDTVYGRGLNPHGDK